MSRSAVVCPRCKTKMDYGMETENLADGTKRIKSYYKCTVCSYRIEDMLAIIEKSNGSARLKVTFHEKFF